MGVFWTHFCSGCFVFCRCPTTGLIRSRFGRWRRIYSKRFVRVPTLCQRRVAIFIRLLTRTLYEDRHHRKKGRHADLEHQKSRTSCIVLARSITRQKEAGTHIKRLLIHVDHHASHNDRFALTIFSLEIRKPLQTNFILEETRFLPNWHDSIIMNDSNDINKVTIMDALSANEAKTQFGDMLLKAQRAPIQINKNGKPVAVVISMDEYESIEALKLRFLQSRAVQAQMDIKAGNIVDGDSFFGTLETDQYD